MKNYVIYAGQLFFVGLWNRGGYDGLGRQGM